MFVDADIFEFLFEILPFLADYRSNIAYFINNVTTSRYLARALMSFGFGYNFFPHPVVVGWKFLENPVFISAPVILARNFPF